MESAIFSGVVVAVNNPANNAMKIMRNAKNTPSSTPLAEKITPSLHRQCIRKVKIAKKIIGFALRRRRKIEIFVKKARKI